MGLCAGSRAGRADEVVRIRCDALEPDAAAQVEARTRATLLTTATGNVAVRIDCADLAATVRVVAGARSESTMLSLPAEKPEEALFGAVERTLEALERDSEGSNAAFPAESAIAPAAAAAPALRTPAATRTLPTTVTSNEPGRASWNTGGGALAELWTGAVGYGLRLAVEHRRAPWSFGGAAGWLTTPEFTDAFRTHELHGFAFGALEESGLTGIRGAAGLGISVLTVLPRPDIVVRSATTLPLVFLNLELSRPVSFGRVWLSPALELRIFPGRREVIVDAERRLTLPPLCPALFLALGYRL